MRQFTVYGSSHWIVLGIFVLGAVAVVALGRRREAAAARRFSRIMAGLVLALQLAIQAYSMSEFGVDHGLPLQLSDLAAFVTAYALWSLRQWAYALTYYWGLTLSTQALVSPALRGDDFPSVGFLAFWLIHLFVVWAAIYLTWGLRMRPGWRDYRLAVAATVCWAAVAFTVNAAAGTNYGFLNAKPTQASLLDVLGPWPWYLLPELALVLTVWALMTWPWVRARVPVR
ncbi:MAG TPA: TIGR02206 family membrane protein [Actinophytocola sp.]|uniref:YwaF family protein n=1 Tax=Actinophytocola sp. TaxID=1872138 RepID=UPI002DDD009F|nr:TIGR02206 family membrane protein [Actinophytocola sp.]HEV2783303.1 TIGR02206 family membrane protein [Actinophytocola sp.]